MSVVKLGDEGVNGKKESQMNRRVLRMRNLDPEILMTHNVLCNRNQSKGFTTSLYGASLMYTSFKNNFVALYGLFSAI